MVHSTVTLQTVRDSSHPWVKAVLPLYESAFPLEERRETDALLRLIDNAPEMFFRVVLVDGVPVGLFITWDFGEFCYCEHLAVSSELRSAGIGGKVLEWLRREVPMFQILEVEPAETEMAERRINYYKRNGFILLTQDYMQPSYRAGGESLPLWLMGNRECDPETLAGYVRVIHERVYGFSA
ncbi:GNAT family N-acetyltransferase [Akkermansia glycaniphila]|uniref:GNAT family N-acetyltransferase n=1 Tax=Akkermansia glycaniphila TaxID=1679444 RepID=UPI001C01E8CC|nr:GNAT family N-acetyltransferase [Akkermansia glycaniphila]MBT9449779.1 GNAT family N-acetyltransferase [Akkermansia glycaniphila]